MEEGTNGKAARAKARATCGEAQEAPKGRGRDYILMM